MRPLPAVSNGEALLVEMQSLLHRIAMVQLSPSALGSDMAIVETPHAGTGAHRAAC